MYELLVFLGLFILLIVVPIIAILAYIFKSRCQYCDKKIGSKAIICPYCRQYVSWHEQMQAPPIVAERVKEFNG